MCTGAELIPFLSAGASTGINVYGTNSAANAAANASQEGTDQQRGFAQAMGLSQYRTGQDLLKNMPDFSALFNQYAPQKTDFSALFNQYAPQKTDFAGQVPDLLGEYNKNAPNVSQYFDPSKVNTYYNQATQNLNQNVGAQVNQAQGSANEYAAAHGFANQGAFAQGQGQNVRQSFAPQYGQIEQGRAGAMQQLDAGTYSALAQQALQRSQLGQMGFQNRMSAGQQDFGNLMNLFSGRMGAGQQDWGNMLQLLMGRIGAGQQQFGNQKAIADFSGGYNPDYFVPDYFMNMHRNGT